MRDHQARVKVSDEVQTAFREATRGSSVAIALGDLVTREVDRYRARRAREGSADEQELLEALERAQELHADLAELVNRLERRLDVRDARPRQVRSLPLDHADAAERFGRDVEGARKWLPGPNSRKTTKRPRAAATAEGMAQGVRTPEKDAIPSGGDLVVIPQCLRAQVRVAAEWRVVKACKNVTVPMEFGAVCDAVHELDGFDRDELPVATLIDLGKEAIAWWIPTARPHTTRQWEELLTDLDLIRELVMMIERLAAGDG